MFELFRKAKKAYVVLITVMLLLPVQQSFSQTVVSGVTSVIENSTMNMEHCKTTNYTNRALESGLSSAQQENCCDENNCDPSNCSFSISFIALFPNQDLVDLFLPQQHVATIEQREIRVLSSDHYRPPRKIQS